MQDIISARMQSAVIITFNTALVIIRVLFLESFKKFKNYNKYMYVLINLGKRISNK